MVEKMPKIPTNTDFPQDYSKHNEFYYNYTMVKEMKKSGLDYLIPYPSSYEPEMQLTFEDDQQIIDDVLDISKPKALIETPQRTNTTLDQMLKKTPYQVSLSKMIHKANPQKKRNFYFGNSEEIRLRSLIKYMWQPVPPKFEDVQKNCKYGIRCLNQQAFISVKRSDLLLGLNDPQILNAGRMKDLPDFANRLLKIESKNDLYSNQYLYLKPPPSYAYVFAASRQSTQDSNLLPVRKNIKRTTAIASECLPLCIVYIEVFAKSRENLLSNPEIDSVFFVVLLIRDDLGVNSQKIIQIGKGPNIHRSKHDVAIQYCSSEKDLFRIVSDEILVCDADVIMSYEAEKAGIGYMIKRAKCIGSDFVARTSRQTNFIVQQTYTYKKLSSLLPGRIILSCWRLIKMETNFYHYSLQNCLYSCLNIRFPYYSAPNLKRMYSEKRTMVYDYYWDILLYTKRLNEHYSFLERNVGLARIYGIDYESVFTRGSQFRVEAMLKKQVQSTGFLLLSAMKDQVANQNKLLCIPLVLEPPKQLWTDPVIVLDFQSLYPSIMISYNLCYSTCLGKIKTQAFKKFGCTHMKGDVFDDNDIIITPNNIGFVKKHVREGFISLMMHELLQSRIMVKNSMKMAQNNTSRWHKLFIQQLGIKLLCNTTYGYAGAGETGRMPCNDIADSIVAIARRTLEDAISLVNSNSEWSAQVIYGDTDSMMVLLPGRTVEQAFAIGKEIAAQVTAKNPKPIELILEKVYFPMLTLAKKHYAGMKYEKANSTPEYEARGIETVRTDFCPLSSKILQEVLETLFNTRDISQVHKLLLRQWDKIISNKYPLKEFIMYQKVILGEYKNPPAGIKVSLQNMGIDKMRRPLFGEKIGYVVISGEPDEKITDLGVDPEDFMASSKYTLNLSYYMDKQINVVLDRTLSPLGINVKAWYKSIPKKNAPLSIQNLQPSKALIKKNIERIDTFYKSAHCFICRKRVNVGALCEICMSTPQSSVLAIKANINSQELKLIKLSEVCRECTGTKSEISCTSLDCPIYYSRMKICNDFGNLPEKLKDLSW